MHVMGEGDPVKLAQALHDGLAVSKTPIADAPPLETTPAIDTVVAELDAIMAAKGQGERLRGAGPFPRAEKITDGGMPVPPAMGSAVGINFQLAGGEKAAITGDFVLLSDEVNPVLRALRDNGIEVTALHSHMLGRTAAPLFHAFLGE